MAVKAKVVVLSDLVKKVAAVCNITQAETRRIFAATKNIIVDELSSGKKIVISGMCTVTFNKRNAKVVKGLGREAMTVPAKIVPRIKALSELKTIAASSNIVAE